MGRVPSGRYDATIQNRGSPEECCTGMYFGHVLWSCLHLEGGGGGVGATCYSRNIQ